MTGMGVSRGEQDWRQRCRRPPLSYLFPDMSSQSGTSGQLPLDGVVGTPIAAVLVAPDWASIGERQ